MLSRISKSAFDDRRLQGDKRAHAVPAHDRAFLFQVAERLAQGRSRDAKLAGKLVFRGQPIPGRVAAALHEMLECFAGLCVKRPLIGSQRDLGDDSQLCS